MQKSYRLSLGPSHDLTTCPINTDMGDIEKNKKWLPKHLQIFMESLIKKPLQHASIGQAIVNSVKPKSSLAPYSFRYIILT